MSAYRKQVDKEHIGAYVLEGYDPMSKYIKEEVADQEEEENVLAQEAVDKMFKMDEDLEHPPSPVHIATPDSPINKTGTLDIPCVPLQVLDILKESKLSKVMKNKVMDLPKPYLEDVEGVSMLVEMLEKKTTFKKAVSKVYEL